MDMYQLECFVTLARRLNFTKAAIEMNITQPAFSRKILSLESELGVSLFLRDKRSVNLTKAGEYFLEEAKNILEHFQAGQSKVIEAEKGLRGSIKIGFLPSQFDSTLPKAANMFRKKYPNILLDISECEHGNIMQRLYDADLDIVFSIFLGMVEIPDIAWQPLLKLDQAVILPPDHPLATRDSIRIADIKDEPFIVFDSDDYSMSSDVVFQICKKNDFAPRVRKRTTSISSAFTLVGCGEGICIAPMLFKSIYPQKICFIKLEDNHCDIFRGFAWHRENHNESLPLFIQEISEAY